MERLHTGAPGLYTRPPEPVRALTGERMDVCAFVGVAPRGPAAHPRLRAAWAEPLPEDGRLWDRSVPVPVESWLEYERLYGGFAGPGLLPWAVAAFFENGGARAFIVRVVPAGGGDDVGAARGALSGLTTPGGRAVLLRARNPGLWGDRLAARLVLEERPFPFDPAGATLGALALPAAAEVVPGTLLRFVLPPLPGEEVPRHAVRSVTRLDREWHPERGVTLLRALLSAPLPGLPTAAGRVEGTLEVFERAQTRVQALPLTLDDATLSTLDLPPGTRVAPGTALRLRLSDGATAHRLAHRVHSAPGGVRVQLDQAVAALPEQAWAISEEAVAGAGQRVERFERLGLCAQHPRWLARVLAEESGWVWPDERDDTSWLDADLDVPEDLGGTVGWSSGVFVGGEDRYESLAPSDFFGAYVPGDDPPPEGVHALAGNPEVAVLCVPDLYAPAAHPSHEGLTPPSSVAGAAFAPCVAVASPLEAEPPPPGLDGLRLDPFADLEQIITLQQALVDFAEQERSFHVLLDVPPGLSDARIAQWRSRFSSRWAACFHPWLLAARPGAAGDRLVRLPPSAVAAGVVAERERAHGLAYGPANVLARGVVDVQDRVGPARHDALHPLGINVYRVERDGVRLTAARTLSHERPWRQLSVCRIVAMLRRALLRQTQWAVFEPNGPRLWADLAGSVKALLRPLHRAGAFAGAREAEAFFVRCGPAQNPPQSTDLGRVVCEIGVAPSEPLEFIVLTLVRDGDGAIGVGG